MSERVLAEADPQLLKLLARVTQGEEVVITLAGRPVARLEPLPREHSHGPITARDLEWLDQHRVGRMVSGSPNAAELIGQMRDEGEH